MNIVMMTNTYYPFVGGVEKSIRSFSRALQRQGHAVLVVTAQKGAEKNENPPVFTVPAIQKFNGTDFSVKLPISGDLNERLEDFKPHIIHTHHPFLIGGTALRAAARFGIPSVFTFHTYYEKYTHYVPGDSPALKRFVVALSTGYANLCSQVIAPSQGVANTLRQRGVDVPIAVIPTGVEEHFFDLDDGHTVREEFGISPHAFLAGFISRLAEEKNVDFLTEAVSQWLKFNPESHFLVAGDGPSRKNMEKQFLAKGVSERVHFTGMVTGERLKQCFGALDVFTFASQSETQGMVLAEAMACGKPVIALEGTGVNDVVNNGENGILVKQQEVGAFADALTTYQGYTAEVKKQYCEQARKTGESLSQTNSVDALLGVYESTQRSNRRNKAIEDSLWDISRRRFKTEWEIVTNVAESFAEAVTKK